MQDDLDHLLLRVAKRDSVAFRTLYDFISPKLFAVLIRITRDKRGAEDLLQEVFLTLWKKAETFSPDSGGAWPWIVTIARNRAIDVMRAKKPEVVAPDENGVDWYETIADDRDDEAQFMRIADLRHCLGEVEEPTRSCILRAYYEGYSREELAVIYDRPVNTIKTWLHRGLASLQTCLEGTS